MTITTEQLQQCTSNTSDELLDALNIFLPQFNITETKDVASFIAQTSHESGDYAHLVENLNYKAASLIATWPKHFDESNASDYEHNQEKIANRVYASRMGNGAEDSGDGFLFRGAGALQLTGRYNHQKFADAIGKDISEIPAYLKTIMGAIHSACWFWTTTPKLEGYAILGDINDETKIINGGTIGLADRQARYNKCLAALSV
jgi:putative chitinase